MKYLATTKYLARTLKQCTAVVTSLHLFRLYCIFSIQDSPEKVAKVFSFDVVSAQQVSFHLLARFCFSLVVDIEQIVFSISSLVLLPSPVTLSVFSAPAGPFSWLFSLRKFFSIFR